MEKLKDSEDINFKLENELENTAKKMINHSDDLEYSQTELKKCRREINVSIIHYINIIHSFD